MRRGGSIIEEQMVGEDLMVSKPMRFKVSATYLQECTRYVATVQPVCMNQ